MPKRHQSPWETYHKLTPILNRGKEPGRDDGVEDLEALCRYAETLERKVLELTLGPRP